LVFFSKGHIVNGLIIDGCNVVLGCIVIGAGAARTTGDFILGTRATGAARRIFYTSTFIPCIF
jgi:hypothetical protein